MTLPGIGGEIPRLATEAEGEEGSGAIDVASDPERPRRSKRGVGSVDWFDIVGCKSKDTSELLVEAIPVWLLSLAIPEEAEGQRASLSTVSWLVDDAFENPLMRPVIANDSDGGFDAI